MEDTARILSEGSVLTGTDPLEDHLSLFFVQVIIILGVCRGLAILGQKLGQPSVIFEIVGGILLGPSLISRDEYFHYTLFSTASRSYLQLIANIGLVLYLFIVGMELDPKLLLSHGKQAFGIALIGMAVPFALGIAISRKVFDTLQSDVDESKFIGFMVFMGTAMSITAFPVLARILKEEGLIYTKAGAMVMGAAAINDAFAWCLLILAVALANSGEIAVAGYVFLCVVAVAIGLAVIVRPLFHQLVFTVESWKSPAWNRHLFTLTLVLMFLCSWTTALLGVHAIFGAFLFGLIVPKNTKLFHECNEKIEDIVVTLFLPIYFTLSGLNTDVTQIRTNKQGAMVVLVCFIATIGKFIGCGGFAYLTGMKKRESCVVMVLMNTRGLVELIVLNLGLTYKLMTVETFSVMVLMCLFTTFLTCPLVNLIYPRNKRKVVQAVHKKSDEEINIDEITIRQQMKETGFQPPKDLRVTVVVDLLPQMETLMRVLSLHSPLTMDSRLMVSAIKFYEPTNSALDVPIGLASDGRLINVVEEPVTVRVYSIDESLSGQAQSVAPVLLPLSIFCKTVGSSVQSFQVRGDPNEFPTELRNVASTYQSDYVIVPWREGDYVKQLFWHSLSISAVPLMLMVQKGETAEHYEHWADNAGRSASNRSRSNSMTSAFLGGGDIEMAMTSHNKHGLPVSTKEDSESLRPTQSGRGRSNSITDTIIKKMASEIEPFAYDSAAAINGKVVKDVVFLLTGKATDRILLEIAARIAERASVNILVLISADKAEFDEAEASFIAKFQEWFVRAENVTIVTLKSSSTDPESLVDEVATFKSQMLFMSYYSPVRASSAGLNAELREHLDSLGVPSQVQNSGLDNPEIGVLGTKLHGLGIFDTLMIMHNTRTFAKRRATIRATFCSDASNLLPNNAELVEQVAEEAGERSV